MIRKFEILALIVLIGLFAFGCAMAETEPETGEEPFDREALIRVNAYVDEMGAALQDEILIADLRGWIREPYVEEMPLRYDEERRQWLLEHQETLEKLYRGHRDGNFPAEDEITGWEVVVVRGASEWELVGSEVAAALKKIDELYGEMAAVIAMIDERSGELDMDDSERVLTLLESIEPVVEEVRNVFYPGDQEGNEEP